jgi:methionine--tRNA ligase beta chain
VQLDDGTPEGRQVCAGIKAWYDPESLVGKQVVIVANLEPRTIRGERSQGMILAASEVLPGEEGERNVMVLTVDKPVPPGSKVS